MIERWGPRWAPHVSGSYEHDPDGGDGGAPVWRYDAACRACGASYRGACATGEVRARICDFARLHLHRDPLG